MLLLENPKDGEEYYVLLAYPQWTSKKDPDDKHYKIIWMQIRSYLVPRKGYRKFWNWLKKQNFDGLPEGLKLFKDLIGEYPWALPYRAFFSTYVEWQNINSYLDQKFKILTTSHELLYEKIRDASIDESISIEVPAKEFFLNSNLYWDGKGKYVTEEGKVAFIFPAIYEPGPYALLVERNFLEEFLEENKAILVWTVLAEKQCIHGASFPTLGFTIHSRAHLLKNGKIYNSEAINYREK